MDGKGRFGGKGALTVEMALERVGLGPVVLAPNKRFMMPI